MGNAPLSWVRQITSEIEELSQIPLFGNAPPFDWESFSKILSSHFDVGELSIHSSGQDFKESSKILEGIDTNLCPITVNITPIGDVSWVMSQADIDKLTAMMLKESKKMTPIPSNLLKEGFYRYLLLEGLHGLQKISPLNQFSFQLKDQEVEVDKAFCIDIHISLSKVSCWGRLILPTNFHKNWVQYFSKQQSEYISSETSKKISLTVGIQMGLVRLHQKDLENLKPGDFVLLDKSSYDARRGTGVCMLMLQSNPLFKVKIKQNKIELIDYAFYYEDNMEENPPPESPELPENLEANPIDNEPPAPLSEEPKTFQIEEEGSIAIKEMPLNVTVELGRIRMTLDELMKLNPGNLLELPIHPDQGVSLTVNGKKIGTAELVYLGEQLGIRILEV